jgi:UDP-glucose 4-epimerase
LTDGHVVVGYDNLSTGQEAFLQTALQFDNFTFVRADLLNLDSVTAAMRGAEFVFHLAANADVRFGTVHPCRDLEQNTIATNVVLRAMRENGIGKIAFASSGSVYGDCATIPTPEDAPFPVQTSLYGASKSACEGLITAYCAGFEFRAYIFRFASVLGERYTHGHIFDFFNQLTQDPSRLRVLGNGRQRKTYLYVQDCVDAMLRAIEQSTLQVNILNLATDGYCDVNDSIGWICGALHLTPSIEYSGGDRGWAGDSPFVYLDTAKIRATGWLPKVTIREAVIKTVEYLRKHPGVLAARR